MTALTITYHQAVKANACGEALDKMRGSDHIGGDWGRFGRDTPIPVQAVWDVLGEEDMWWALWAVDRTTYRLLTSDFAAHVHKFFDRERPEDERPRDAIRVTRAGDAARDAAWGAAWAAAWAAAWDAAGDAARGAAWAAAWAAARVAAEDAARAAVGDAARVAAEDAARAAERDWQTQHIRAVLRGAKQPGRVQITMHKPEEAVRP